MFDNKERKLIATLWENIDPDEEDKVGLDGGGDLSPVKYELVEDGDEEPILRLCRGL